MDYLPKAPYLVEMQVALSCLNSKIEYVDELPKNLKDHR